MRWIFDSHPLASANARMIMSPSGATRTDRAVRWGLCGTPSTWKGIVFGGSERRGPCCQNSVGNMAHQMVGDELDKFLSMGTRTGKLATVRADGSPHVAPVWFILDGGDLVFMTGAKTVKGRAMLRDPRVALSVDDENPPYAFATIEGIVSISRDLDEMLPLSIAIARRYVGDELAEQYGRRNAVDGELLLRLNRLKVSAEAGISD